MATKREISRLDDAEDGDFIEVRPQDISDLEDDIDSELSKIKSEFDKDDNDVSFEVRIYKTVPNSAELEYLFTCTPAELPVQDRVRDEYGAGAYQVRVYKITSKGKALHRRFSFRIAAPRPAYMQQQPQQKNGEDVTGIVRAMMEQNQKQMQQFQEMMMAMAMKQTQAPAQAFNPMEMMQGMASMLTAMQAMFPKPAGGNEVNTLIQGMTLAKELLGDSAGGGGERNLFDALTETVKTFGPVMGQALVSRPRPAPATPRPAQPAPMAAVPAAPAALNAPRQNPIQPTTTENPEMNAMKMVMLKNYLGQLVNIAATDGDHTLYAELICENLSDDEIEHFVTGPDGLDNLARINEGVNTYRTWFDKLKSEVNELLTEPESGASVTGMDVAHSEPGTHGESSTTGNT